jgi:peptidase YpeB-like protein
MKTLISMLAFLLVAVAPLASASTKSEQAALQKEAKISMKHARSIALKAAPGTIASEELERENGRLIYSFDIKNKKGEVTEVNVNAMNGEVVDTHHESAAKEAAEKKQESREKTGKH